MLKVDGIGEFISRSAAEVPESFVPSANAIVVAPGDDLLWFLGPMVVRDYGRESNRWVGGVRKGLFRSVTADNFLAVRRYNELWSIERELKNKGVLALNSKPVFFRDYKAAMAIAKHCHPNPPEKARRHLAWMPSSHIVY
jgi:hypothetical protein